MERNYNLTKKRVAKISAQVSKLIESANMTEDNKAVLHSVYEGLLALENSLKK